jgi:hypothetical protein
LGNAWATPGIFVVVIANPIFTGFSRWHFDHFESTHTKKLPCQCSSGQAASPIISQVFPHPCATDKS